MNQEDLLIRLSEYEEMERQYPKTIETMRQAIHMKGRDEEKYQAWEKCLRCSRPIRYVLFVNGWEPVERHVCEGCKVNKRRDAHPSNAIEIVDSDKSILEPSDPEADD